MPIIEPISPQALLYSYPFESLKKATSLLPSIGAQLASLDQLSPPTSSSLTPKGVFSTSIQPLITVPQVTYKALAAVASTPTSRGMGITK